MVRLDCDLSFARWAIQEVPSYSRRRPFSKNAFADTLDMENVLASKNYWRLVGKATNHTDTAIILLWIVLVQLEVYELLIVRPDALLVDAW